MGSRGLGEADFEAVAVFLDRGIKIAAEVGALAPHSMRGGTLHGDADASC